MSVSLFFIAAVTRRDEEEDEDEEGDDEIVEVHRRGLRSRNRASQMFLGVSSPFAAM